MYGHLLAPEIEIDLYYHLAEQNRDRQRLTLLRQTRPERPASVGLLERCLLATGDVLIAGGRWLRERAPAAQTMAGLGNS